MLRTTPGTSITDLKKLAESSTVEVMTTDLEAHCQRVSELDNQEKLIAAEKSVIKKHILSLQYVMADKARLLAIEEAQQRFKEKLDIYKDEIAYQRQGKTDLLCEAARSLKYEFKLYPTQKAIAVMNAAGDVLANNTPETRAKLIAEMAAFENKTNKGNRFAGTCLLFIACAALIGSIAMGLTGVGAIPALFLLVSSVALFSGGLYLIAEYEQSRMEWAVDNFAYASKPSFFANSKMAVTTPIGASTPVCEV